MLKSVNCGELRSEDADRTVVLAGWVHRRRDHGNLIFIDLRDRDGLVQVVVNPTTDLGTSGEENVKYVLRWETLTPHHDKPRKPPLSPASTLRFFRLEKVSHVGGGDTKGRPEE